MPENNRPPASAPTLSGRLQPAAPWLCAAAALAPVLFVAWQAAAYFYNAPFWDEFVTVLDFLGKYRRTDSWSGLASLFFSESNDQHRILTSRLILVAFYRLTGGINFVHLAVLGNLFGVAAIAVIAWQQPTRPLRWLLAALLSLLVFQLQHYENLFLSYASIDHFHIVLLAAVSLALLARGGRWPAGAALGVAGVAVFTLAQGLAIFPAGGLLLAVQRRWRSLAAWSAGAVVAATGFFWGFSGAGQSLGALAAPAGWWQLGRFWLTLLGAVPSLGWPVGAPVLGVAALVVFGWLLARGAFAREPFLCALALFVLGSTLLIAYGRFNIAGVPALGSRYMVQSAVLWAVLLMLGLKTRSDARVALRTGLAALPALVVLNVAADVRFFREARFFVEKRIAAIQHYDKTGSFANAPYPVFPLAAQADQIIAQAAATGIFQLQPRNTPWVQLPMQPEASGLIFHLDELIVGRTHLHVRGWLLPPTAREVSFQPHLFLRADGREFVSRGRRQDRPDVAAALRRPEAVRCGFEFVVPHAGLPAGRLDVALALVGRGRAFVTATGSSVDLPQRR